MKTLLKRLTRRRYVFMHDLAMIPVAWLGSYWFRHDFDLSGAELTHALGALLVVVPAQALVFWGFGLYRGVWRFASIPDLVRIVKAVIVGVGFSVILLFVVTRLDGVPRSVPLLYSILLITILGGPRLVYRWITDYRLYIHQGKRVLVVGAGRAGEMLARDLLRDPNHSYQPLAFVDDDPLKRGKDVHGVRVVGGIERIPEIAETREIDVVLLAIPSATSKEVRRVMELCEQVATPVRTVPRLHDLMSGGIAIDQLRNVGIEDLLGREPVRLDWDAISSGLKGSTILVTGAGGSIGSELCRQLAAMEPGKLVLYENSEFNLYRIELELRESFPRLDLEVRLGDVCDRLAMSQVMSRFQPAVMFHAAAYKHVPMLEHQMRQAVRNNVLGTRVVAELADQYRCERFVLISTDKAVNPVNVMGCTKRVAELFCQNLDTRSETRYVTVRFGNVLGSAGSVLPRFRAQLEMGGPLTVTHPEITRYFMTIPEACQLIMQASVLGKGGEIFVLDMGEPVSITYLAEQLIRLAGKVPGQDIEIVFTGLRPGEKLYEELFHAGEPVRPTCHEKIMLSGVRKVEWSLLVNTFDELALASEEGDDARLQRLLRILVPEFDWSGAANGEVAEGGQSNVR